MKHIISQIIPPIFLSLIKKVFGTRSVVSSNQSASRITIGERSELHGSINKVRAPHSQVKIGRDCLIQGHITMETNEAILEVGDNVFIGPSTSIVCVNRIRIESDVLISSDCMIQDSDNHSFDYEIRKKDVADWKKGYHDWSQHPSLPILIGHGSWIGARAIILKGVTIGEKVIVGAGSVVTRSADPYTIVAGNPAKLIRSLNVGHNDL